MPNVTAEDKEHKVPSGFWKIVVVEDAGSLKVAAFIMNQNAESTNILGYLVTVEEVETKSGLDFLWELPDDKENAIEATKDEAWVQQWL